MKIQTYDFALRPFDSSISELQDIFIPNPSPGQEFQLVVLIGMTDQPAFAFTLSVKEAYNSNQLTGPPILDTQIPSMIVAHSISHKAYPIKTLAPYICVRLSAQDVEFLDSSFIIAMMTVAPSPKTD